MSKDLTYVQNLRVHSRRLREIASVLDGEGLRFGLEYVAPRTLLNAQRYTFVHTMAEMKDLIAEIGQSERRDRARQLALVHRRR